jgi:hypothetical protein
MCLRATTLLGPAPRPWTMGDKKGCKPSIKRNHISQFRSLGALADRSLARHRQIRRGCHERVGSYAEDGRRGEATVAAPCCGGGDRVGGPEIPPDSRKLMGILDDCTQAEI